MERHTTYQASLGKLDHKSLVSYSSTPSRHATISHTKDVATTMADILPKYNVARHYEKRALLILVNAVAGLSIFFFGYDQGVMGGVNTNRNYARTMQFGHWDGEKVAVDHELKKGGIVRLDPLSRDDFTCS